MSSMKFTTTARTAALVVVAGALVLSGCTKKNDTTSTGGSGAARAAARPRAARRRERHQGRLRAEAAGHPLLRGDEHRRPGGAKQLGFTWLYQGPTTADAAAQAQIVRSYIQQKVNTLIVAPNDPDSMAPVLQQAQAAGIKVLTSDTDAPNSVRQGFVSQATAEGIGTALVDDLAKVMGDKGKYAIVSCGETAENLNSWIAVQKKVTPRSTRTCRSSTSSTRARTRTRPPRWPPTS